MLVGELVFTISIHFVSISTLMLLFIWKVFFFDISTFFIVQIEYFRIFIFRLHQHNFKEQNIRGTKIYYKMKKNNICSPSFTVEQSKTNWSWTEWNKTEIKSKKESIFSSFGWCDVYSDSNIIPFLYLELSYDRLFAVSSRLCVFLYIRLMNVKKQNKNIKIQIAGCR